MRRDENIQKTSKSQILHTRQYQNYSHMLEHQVLDKPDLPWPR